MSVETKPTTNTVTLEDAKKWTQLWQKETKDKPCKAFLIPALDLTEVLKEMNILIKNELTGNFELKEATLPNAGVRAYTGIDTTNGTGKDNGYGEKLLIVGTTKEVQKGGAITHKDITVDPITGESRIYDFTEPCPNTCDVSSSLYDKI